MTRFDFSERPLWSLVGDAYLCLLEPLRVESAQPVAGRARYVATLRQVGARPTRGDLDAQGYVLTQAMPAIVVHIREGRVEERTTQSLDWQLDVDVHCFCGGLDQGSEIREDHIDGIRSLTQHVTEYLHGQLPPTKARIDGKGINIEAIEEIITTERVVWWVVRTTVMVRQEIRRQRTAAVKSVEFQQFGLPKAETPHVTTVLDFESASALTTNKKDT